MNTRTARIPARTRWIIALLVALAGLMAANVFSIRLPFGAGVRPAAAAAVDYFLKVDGIKGESQDARHAEEIVIQSYSFGFTVTPPPSGGGAGGGKAICQDIAIKKVIDKSSPDLMKATLDGRSIPNVTLTGVKNGGTTLEFLKIQLQEVTLTSFQEAATGDIPADAFTLKYTRISFREVSLRSDGTPGPAVTTNWDCAANAAF